MSSKFTRPDVKKRGVKYKDLVNYELCEDLLPELTQDLKERINIITDPNLFEEELTKITEKIKEDGMFSYDTEQMNEKKGKPPNFRQLGFNDGTVFLLDFTRLGRRSHKAFEKFLKNLPSCIVSGQFNKTEIKELQSCTNVRVLNLGKAFQVVADSGVVFPFEDLVEKKAGCRQSLGRFITDKWRSGLNHSTYLVRGIGYKPLYFRKDDVSDYLTHYDCTMLPEKWKTYDENGNIIDLKFPEGRNGQKFYKTTVLDDYMIKYFALDVLVDKIFLIFCCRVDFEAEFFSNANSMVHADSPRNHKPFFANGKFKAEFFDSEDIDQPKWNLSLHELLYNKASELMSKVQDRDGSGFCASTEVAPIWVLESSNNDSMTEKRCHETDKEDWENELIEGSYLRIAEQKRVPKKKKKAKSKSKQHYANSVLAEDEGEEETRGKEEIRAEPIIGAGGSSNSMRQLLFIPEDAKNADDYAQRVLEHIVEPEAVVVQGVEMQNASFGCETYEEMVLRLKSSFSEEQLQARLKTSVNKSEKDAISTELRHRQGRPSDNQKRRWAKRLKEFNSKKLAEALANNEEPPRELKIGSVVEEYTSQNRDKSTDEYKEMSRLRKLKKAPTGSKNGKDNKKRAFAKEFLAGLRGKKYKKT